MARRRKFRGRPSRGRRRGRGRTKSQYVTLPRGGIRL